jgi:hypothetical protein
VEIESLCAFKNEVQSRKRIQINGLCGILTYFLKEIRGFEFVDKK